MGRREDGQGSGESVEAALDSGVTSMVSDEVRGDKERPGSGTQPASEGQTLEAGGGPSGGSSDAPGSTPVGLGLGGLQPLPSRVSQCMPVVIDGAPSGL